MSQLTIIAFARAQADKVEELGRRMLALVEPSRNEPGCINYDLHRSNDDLAVWCVYENWRSEEDLTAHFQTPHMTAFITDVPDLVEGEVVLQRFTMRSVVASG